LALKELYDKHDFESTREGARFLAMNRSNLDRILTGKTQVYDATRVLGMASRLGASQVLANQLFLLAVQTHDSNASGFHSPSWHANGLEGPPFWILEAEADRFDILELTMITGLMQTEAYIEAQAKADPFAAGDSIEAIKQYKLSRQRRRFGPEGKAAAGSPVVLAEQCLTAIRGEDFFEEQMEHMLNLVEQHGIGVYILPMAHPYNLQLTRPFTIMGFDNQESVEVVYMESYQGSEWTESKAAVERCRKLYVRLEGVYRAGSVCRMLTNEWRKSSRSSNNTSDQNGQCLEARQVSRLSADWQRSSPSSGNDNWACLEARRAYPVVQVRDSKLGEGSPILDTTSADWLGFLAAVAKLPLNHHKIFAADSANSSNALGFRPRASSTPPE
jgi:hypothetical protein